MKYRSVFHSIGVFILFFINLFLIFQVILNRRHNKQLSHKIQKTEVQNKKYNDYIRSSIGLFRIPISDVVKSFKNLIENNFKKPCFVAFIPSNVCKACIANFFSEVNKSKINAKNFYLISEIDDRLLQRQWVSYGYDRNKFVTDKYEVFKRSGLGKKIVLIKFMRDINHYDLFQYELFLGELFENFINEDYDEN